jgi:hypothetical protein
LNRGYLINTGRFVIVVRDLSSRPQSRRGPYRRAVAVLEPLIPDPPRRADGPGRGPGGTRGTCSTVSFGYFALAPPGAVCQSATHPTRDLLPPSLRAVERGGGAGRDPSCPGRGPQGPRSGLDLSECFIDGTFVVGAKKGEDRWERPSGVRARSSWR